FVFSLSRRPATCTLFPYTTLFRSGEGFEAPRVSLAELCDIRRSTYQNVRRTRWRSGHDDETQRVFDGRRRAESRCGGERTGTARDRKSTRLKLQSRFDLVCRLLLE